MCCDICPYYDECEELEELQEECCPECPDYHDCQEREGAQPPEEEGSETDRAID
jgi:hypothetical protein